MVLHQVPDPSPTAGESSPLILYGDGDDGEDGDMMVTMMMICVFVCRRGLIFDFCY